MNLFEGRRTAQHAEPPDWVLKPDGDSWQIIHEHTSVPLGPDLKGKLAREP